MADTPIMRELAVVMRRVFVPKMVAEILQQGALLQTRRRTWRERLLSWPWRPWVATVTEFRARGIAPYVYTGNTHVGCFGSMTVETSVSDD